MSENKNAERIDALVKADDQLNKAVDAIEKAAKTLRGAGEYGLAFRLGAAVQEATFVLTQSKRRVVKLQAGEEVNDPSAAVVDENEDGGIQAEAAAEGGASAPAAAETQAETNAG